MKQLIFTIVAFLTFSIPSNAMGYQQARLQALFLTDKMAYELNLTEEQYEAAYEINLDYLMSLNTVDDLYGAYWTYRNLDFSYILFDWQYRAFVNTSYFYRPVWMNRGYWSFGIYARYPRRDYFYFGEPRFYTVYRGGHSWQMNGGRSWYYERDFVGPRQGRDFGMRDQFDRGYYGDEYRFSGVRAPRRDFQNDRTRSFGSTPNRYYGGGYAPSRESSTRTTVGRYSGVMRNNSFEGSRSFGNGTPSRSFNEPNRSFSPSQTPRSSSQLPSRSFSPSQGSNSLSTPSRTFGSSPSRSFGSGTFSGHR